MSGISTREEDGILFVYFRDPKILDEALVVQLRKELLDAVNEVPDKRMIINFQGVQFMCSAMIQALVLINKKVRAEDIALVMCAIAPNVLEVFKITRLDKVFDIVVDEERAERRLSRRSSWWG